eukprot:m.126105 g.126105  ORF g.126105 m.126105 type:complete len:231 (+) comp9434_c1_seq3:142-834(+)
MSVMLAGTMDRWKKVNPAWEVKLWRNEDVKALWLSKYSRYKDVWEKALPIQRADIGRLMIIDTFGGLYADLDCMPSKNIDDIFDSSGFRHVMHDTVVCLEDDKTPEQMAGTAKWAIRKGVPEYHRRVANYVFWAKPGAATIQEALKLAIRRVRTTDKKFYHYQGKNNQVLNNPYAIIYTTGPDVLTEATFSLKNNRKPLKSTHVVGEGKCFMTNKATGTWIGNNHPAWGQ